MALPKGMERHLVKYRAVYTSARMTDDLTFKPFQPLRYWKARLREAGDSLWKRKRALDFLAVLDPAYKKELRAAERAIREEVERQRAERQEAERQGYSSLILSAGVEGETREVAKVHAAMAREALRSDNPLAPPACLLSGGETTVTLRGKGRGGRNQEFVLASAIALEGVEGVVVLSGGTDGTDGPTDAAGAIADGRTIARARIMGLDPEDHLHRNDTYAFFQALGELLITGPTRTNVMDVRVVLVNKP